MTEDKRAESEIAAQGKKLLYALWRLEKLMDIEYDGELRVTEIRVRSAREAGEDILVTIKAQTYDGKKFIGFHAAQSLPEALRGAVERLNNATLKWKEDKPFGGG